MNFKTVYGLGRAEYAAKAVNAALGNCQSPHHVDAWLKWFDAQPADASDLNKAIPGDIDRRSQCDCCQVTTVCPDDCPQPEFYVGDLEEVAHAMVTRVGDAIAEYVRVSSDGGNVGMPKWFISMMDGIHAEIAAPGYVEGLIPE